jgi:dihydroorotate dehydrogenase electron transfer subunit
MNPNRNSEERLVIQQRARILKNEKVAPEIFLMEIRTPQVIALGRPGQFLHLRLGEDNGVLLRRPLSIFSRDPGRGAAGILYQRVGRGTQILSGMKPGEDVDILGPLGRAFDLPPERKTAVLVAGGLGVAPLFFLAQDLICRGVSVRFLLGARCKDLLLCVSELRAMGVRLNISTDDGSEGFHGLVTELLGNVLAEERFDPFSCGIYATGPEPMMKKAAFQARRYGLAAQFSLERHMACGLGACLGCVVRCRDEQGAPVYRRVCTDGPVFGLEELPWVG